jgi:hypothetical protein
MDECIIFDARVLINGWFLALTLLEAGVLLVDDEALALTDDDLAIHGSALDAAADLHGVSLRLSGECTRR